MNNFVIFDGDLMNIKKDRKKERKREREGKRERKRKREITFDVQY